MQNIICQWNRAASKYVEDQECSEFVESNKRYAILVYDELAAQYKKTEQGHD